MQTVLIAIYNMIQLQTSPLEDAEVCLFFLSRKEVEIRQYFSQKVIVFTVPVIIVFVMSISRIF